MSAATLAPATVYPAGRPRTTPEILWLAIWSLWIGDVVLLLLVLSAGHVQSSALSTVGRDSAPSIIASQRIKTALADMDADAANELLLPPEGGKAAGVAYHERRQEAASALISAAQNITYGEAERQPILKIQLGMGTYESLIQRARDLHQEGNSAFVGAYNEAAQLLDTSLLPAADSLDEANVTELDKAYAGQHSRSVVARSAVAIGGLILLLVLFQIQVFLARRTRRLINLPLFTASVLVLIFGIGTLRDLGMAETNLKRAKEDAFTSIHALWRARAVLYAANSDESRFLLDPQHGPQRAADFAAKRDTLAKLPAGTSFENADPHEFTGYLADEFNNITFAGEREAATQTLRDFGQYVAIDAQLRDLEQKGKHREAVELCTGTAPGQSDWAFNQLDESLGRTLKINQEAFDASVANGFTVLRYFDLKMGVFAALFALLSLTGLLQRIRDYR